MIDVPRGVASHLFVYGTLRKAARLAEILGDGGDWRYVGLVTVVGDLYDVGEYPALVLREDGGWPVEGELVELSNPGAAFTALDTYEGVDAGLFVRRRCSVRLADGSERVVWVYEYNRPVRGLPRLKGQSGRHESCVNRSPRQLERRR